MPFVKVDDKLPEHPKMLAALVIEPLALGSYVAGLCYCNRNRTDGFIPTLALGSIAPAKPKNVVKALTFARLWHEIEGGYTVHDYLEVQASADHILKKLRKDSARKTNGSSVEHGAKESS
jgi:hypothetical protein